MAQSNAGSDRTRTIHGSVVDGESYEPLAGASVRVRIASGDSTIATPHGAVARDDGSFSITIPYAEKVILETSYIGYHLSRIELGAGEDSARIELEDNPKLEEMVKVTATRRTRSVEDACCRVESIREEVQQHAPFSPSAINVLSRYSSCTSSRISCAVDNSSSTRLRGLEPTYVKVLVDGLPSLTGLSTFYGLSMIPAHALQTIRISEGASSGLYGNGAVSGVVDLETRPPTEIPELSASATLSGEGSKVPAGRDINFAYTGMPGDVGIAAFGSLGMLNEGEIGEPISHNYTRGTGLVKGNIMVDDATELIVSALGAIEKREGIRSELTAPAEGYREEIDLRRIDLSTKIARTLSEESEIALSGLFSTTSVDANYFGPALDATQRTLFANLLYKQELGDHLLQVGGEIFDDRLTERSPLGIGYDIRIGSIFAQDELLLGEQWAVLGSLRLDDHSGAGLLFSPRGSIKFEPVSSLTMRLMAGQGFKGEALFNEEHLVLHGIYRWRNNEAFEFEKSFTLNYDISYSFLIGEDIGIDANFNSYYTTITGKAIPHADSLAAGTLFYINSDRPARLAGMELQLRPSFGTEWNGSLAFQIIEYSLQGNDGVYHRMPLAPRLNVDASLMYHNDDLGFTAESWGSYIGAQRLPENPYGITESTPYTLVNARVEKAFGPVAIYLGAFNLLDAKQIDTMPLDFHTDASRINSGVVWGPIEGREFFVGARWTMGGGEE